MPEFLIDDVKRLAETLTDYGINAVVPNFKLNDYSNWVPACEGCNNKKGSHLLPKEEALEFLSRVHKNRHRVNKELVRLERERRSGKALAHLANALERDAISEEDVAYLLNELKYLRTIDEPVVITFGLNIFDLLESDVLDEDVPRELPALYDWLEDDLHRRLALILSSRFHATEPSLRNGECLSVRLVFPRLIKSELQQLNSLWWEILEVDNFYGIYGTLYKEVYPEYLS